MSKPILISYLKLWKSTTPNHHIKQTCVASNGQFRMLTLSNCRLAISPIHLFGSGFTIISITNKLVFSASLLV